MSNKKISILITGAGGAGSLGRELMKSFLLSKQKYKIVTTNSSPLSIGLFESKFRYIVPNANSSKYIKKILEICKKENIDVLVGGSEPEIIKIAKNINIFEENNIKVLSNSFPLIKLCSDKLALTKFLEKHNIYCPKTMIYDDSLINKKLEFPIIIKPNSGSGSRNVFVAHDKEEAKFFGNYLKKYGSVPLIQEHIGDYENEYTIGVLRTKDGKLSTSITMKRILEGSLSTRQTTVSPYSKKKFVVSSGFSQGFYDHFEEIGQFGLKIAKILNADGPINIQCRKIGSKFSIFEINPRFSGTITSRSLIGHNEPDILCRYTMFGETHKLQKHQIGYVMKDLTEKFISLNDIKNLSSI